METEEVIKVVDGIYKVFIQKWMIIKTFNNNKTSIANLWNNE